MEGFPKFKIDFDFGNPSTRRRKLAIKIDTREYPLKQRTGETAQVRILRLMKQQNVINFRGTAMEQEIWAGNLCLFAVLAVVLVCCVGLLCWFVVLVCCVGLLCWFVVLVCCVGLLCWF